jgi:hypothetical protein
MLTAPIFPGQETIMTLLFSSMKEITGRNTLPWARRPRHLEKEYFTVGSQEESGTPDAKWAAFTGAFTGDDVNEPFSK